MFKILKKITSFFQKIKFNKITIEEEKPIPKQTPIPTPITLKPTIKKIIPAPLIVTPTQIPKPTPVVISKSEKEIIINISKDEDHRKQMLNKYAPLSSCNTTSFAMALINSEIKVDCPEGVLLADYFTEFLRSQEAYDYQKKYHSWSVGKYNPQEVHAVLSWGINKVIGRTITKFYDGIDTRQLVMKLIEGKSSVVSGSFNGLGHIVCLSGFITTQKKIHKIVSYEEIILDKITNFIIDDPFGDYHDKYKNHSAGNNIHMSKADWLRMLKKFNSWNKRAHILL